jgi:fumarylacetoacetase
VESANDPGGDFPLQNLPLGVFRSRGALPHIGTAIGEEVLDLPIADAAGLLGRLSEKTTAALQSNSLNALMAAGQPAWHELREGIWNLLEQDAPALRDDEAARGRMLKHRDEVEMLMPAVIGDYTDFYASLHHATNVGSMFRPDNPLLPNYKSLPVGYHGRASSIIVSGHEVRRPHGQRKPDEAAPPEYSVSTLLDYELELGVFVGPGNALGKPIPMTKAVDNLFGMVIVNDWSARDVQKWEYQPLGPFNAKNFITSVSPWVVTMEALAPFRIDGPPRGADDPEILEYLKPTEPTGLDLTVQVQLSSAAMRDTKTEPIEISRGSFADMYWTLAQMLVHHSSTGCNMRPGDLLASGTISGPEESMRGCLLERTWRGQHPIALPDGTERKFLQDGDEVIIRAWGERNGAARIGFGECRGVVTPAV